MKTLLLLLSFLIPATFASVEAASNPNPNLKQLKIIQPENPREFPDALARAYPHGGEARVLITVGADGELKESLLTNYSAAPFRDEAVAALKEWKFEAARWMDQPVTVCVEIALKFQHRGTMVSMTATELFISQMNVTNPIWAYRPFALAELDRVPAVVQPVKPIYPEEFAKRGLVGNVTVDFYVDEQGVVRMPSVTQEAKPELADVAVQALRQWKFQPPLVGGKPVLAHLSQTFNFNAAPAGGI